MHIFDSVSKKKVKFEPIKDDIVSIYVCGPTVYDDAHLGHAKSSISFDLLWRTLSALGYNVKFVKNFTDIDDKILNKMKENGKSLKEITNFYIDSYLSDMEKLNIKRATIEPKATENLESIISYIKTLLKKEIAYITNDGVYFDTSKDDRYLSLSGKKDELNIARVKSCSDKKDDKDFALWKFDENWYEAPFGKGRPGWHSECVAMIKTHLDSGDEKYSIDIHAGGMDLLFPHHENEAAQCRCAEHKDLAKYWMHNGFVQVNNEKMSKSLGNSFFIKDALKLVPGEALRFYLMSSHYRANFNYSIDDLLASKRRLDKIYRLKKRVLGSKLGTIDNNFKDEILSALSDDLNISLALSYLDNFVNLSNDYLDKNPKDKTKKGEILANLELVKDIFGILEVDSFEYFQFGVSQDEKAKINSLIEKRDLAKKDKNYALADSIREELSNMGISIMDTANGTVWEKK
ncbi:cysteinyl-tRNA synthetase [Campylobacter blaseri]|uniref:Cysteine--tRNA ligase n=1 Tax=Campylobacter blaseri TaxID=2042961 RepID=A0A2P8R2K8_9BACT|nr:cysteine--tRNA ligase [Campylobacter blaseri]PSM52746.1 cysteine--tRNA ligase [Campylobacter blaseri]PSM54394.1 cysteine--tRNA ligase [Campylobacter blaseri]QKF86054.1 cysteinyl-tRNA synthetase [Campylobacter blaseri]